MMDLLYSALLVALGTAVGVYLLALGVYGIVLTFLPFWKPKVLRSHL